MLYRISERGLRTQVVARSCEPEWNDTFVFNDVSVDKVRSLTVID